MYSRILDQLNDSVSLGVGAAGHTFRGNIWLKM